MTKYFAGHSIPVYCEGCDKEHTVSELSYDIRLIRASDYDDIESRRTVEEATIEIQWCCIEGFVVAEEVIEL